MTQIARKYDFKEKTTAKSAQVDEELNQLVAAHNDLDANKVNRADVLVKGDPTPYVPEASTDPATKGYVDTTLTGLILGQVPDGSITDPKIGTRTIDDTVAADGAADTPTRLWSKLGNMIKAITGKANWFTVPATTLEAANTHMNATSVHGAVSAAAANRLVVRDGNGRAQFASPAVAGDAATKGYADGLTTGLSKIASGTYTGDGTNPRTIAVGFTPKLVVINSGVTSTQYYWANITSTRATLGGGGSGAFAQATIAKIVANGFQVGVPDMNVSGLAYEWTAFG